MDLLTFLSSIAGSIAWPAAVLLSVLILRRPLTRLLPHLRRAHFKDLDLEFGETLKKLEHKADDAKLPEPTEPPPWAYDSPDEWTFRDYIERLAPISPRVAISEAWRYVELALRDAAGQGLENKHVSTVQVARTLLATGKLPRDAVSLIEDLRSLRNKAVHSSDFDLGTDQAVEFAALAERLLATISIARLQGDRAGSDSPP